MKILLVSANTFTEPYPVYPLGLDYVAASFGKTHTVKIIDMNCIASIDMLAAEVRTFAPDLIGISLRNIDNTDASNAQGFIGSYKEIASAIRTNSQSPIVLGGSGFTLFPKELLDELDIDYGIIGEGERFSLFANAIEKGENPLVIPGVVHRKGNAPIPPPWDGAIHRDFKRERLHSAFYLKRGGMLNLQSKRGCCYRCIYCTYPHIEGNTLRLFPPDEVAEIALSLQEAGARYLFISDAVFNCDEDHSMAVAEAFIKKGIRVPWGAYFTPIHPRREYFPLMKRAGLTHIEFGTESLSDIMLQTYRKPFSKDDLICAHNMAVNEGIHVAHFLLLGGPGETKTTVNETLDTALQLPKGVLFFFCGIRIYPHTKLFDIACAEGRISRDTSLLPPLFYQSEAISNQEITAMVHNRAEGRINWIFSSGGKKMAKLLRRLYRRGATGPLWENCIQ